MLKTRFVTATILIAIVLGVLFYLPPAQFCIAMSVVGIWAAWEWTTLVAIQGIVARLLFVVALMLIFFKALFVPISWILITGTIWWVIATLAVIGYPEWGADLRALWIVKWGAGALVLTPCWAALNYLRSQTNGLPLILFLLILVWGADSAAYFVGQKWGRHKLAPAVSPKKSIEGALGACLFAGCLAAVVLMLTHTPFSESWRISLLTIVTVLFSIVGDLFESLLKREANLKDINQWLPGHGGLLDRIDSLTAAAPLFAFGIWLLR